MVVQEDLVVEVPGEVVVAGAEGEAEGLEELPNSSSLQKNVGVLVDKPAAYTCSPEGKLCSGLH